MQEVILPEWFHNLTLAGLALAPVTAAVVQLMKVIGARLGMPEGWGGYIALAVSMAVVLLALGAGFLHMEAEVAEALASAQRAAEAALTFLAALGWYEVGKKARVVRPVRWRG